MTDVLVNDPQKLQPLSKNMPDKANDGSPLKRELVPKFAQVMRDTLNYVSKEFPTVEKQILEALTIED